MAVTWVAAGALAGSNDPGTTLAVTAPACAANDILIACLLWNRNAPTAVGITAPDGTWTEVISGFRNSSTSSADRAYIVFWKLATGSGGSFTFTKAEDDSKLFSGVIGVWRGQHLTVPIDATAPGKTDGTSAADATSFPAFDPTSTDNETVFVAFYADNATAYSAAMSNDTNPDCTIRWDLESSAGPGNSIACTSGPNDGTAIAARTWASNSDTNNESSGVVFALVAAAVAAGPAIPVLTRQYRERLS